MEYLETMPQSNFASIKERLGRNMFHGVKIVGLFECLMEVGTVKLTLLPAFFCFLVFSQNLLFSPKGRRGQPLPQTLAKPLPSSAGPIDARGVAAYFDSEPDKRQVLSLVVNLRQHDPSSCRSPGWLCISGKGGLVKSRTSCSRVRC